MNKELKIYDVEIDELENMIVDMVSIVEHPAIQKNFLAFSKMPKQKLAFSTDDKMQLYGVAMIPDTPIYRKVDQEEFYVKFSPETIENIVHVFMRKGLTNNLNIEHSDASAKSYIFQSILVDNEKGFKAPLGLGNVKDGSWVIGVQVNDKELWQDIKAGKRNGFSVEGLFKTFETKEIVQKVDVDPELNKLFDQFSNWATYLENN